ncbi:isopenicillin N synthase family dioxygenase [Nevskia ramosa]|uniref:isopenicillin N synthase family dioxygenase n=1 Tax=Nevskia ramosa TaxID=64002 RepID=UPI002357F7FE|nr:2-oxoglutarate and iron-dependent oxygenase domain-containing protein [Nevskia ramosa]
MKPSSSVPLINIAPLMSGDLEARSKVASEIGAACRGIGFFAVTGHGIAVEQIDAMFAASQAFFALPLADKRALAMKLHGHNRGYAGYGDEALDEHAAPDLKEAYNLIWTDGQQRPPNLWPSLPGWRETAENYFDAVLAVGHHLHRAFALDLALPELHFADKIDQPMATLRMLHYPDRRTDDMVQGEIGAGAHTDYGNLTLLATDGVAGLQVQPRGSHEWIDVPALPGAFVCNIGDCLMRWSNDVYMSTPHRVLPPPAERYSIAFFLDPNPEALVSAIPSCVPVGGAAKYPPILAYDYLQSRFTATYGG